MTVSTTPSIVAGKLTEAQRNAVLHGKCGVPRTKEEWTPECICGAGEMASLYSLGLASPRVRFPGGVLLTPLGIEVRALLHKEEGCGG